MCTSVLGICRHAQASAALSHLSVSPAALGPLPDGVRDQPGGIPAAWAATELHGRDTRVPALRPTICLAHVSALVASGWLTWPRSTMWTCCLQAHGGCGGAVRRQGHACERSWRQRPAASPGTTLCVLRAGCGSASHGDRGSGAGAPEQDRDCSRRTSGGHRAGLALSTGWVHGPVSCGSVDGAAADREV